MRRLVFLTLFLSAVAPLRFSPGRTANGAASAGQGKGGEVIAKPTPTPKKTTTTKKNPPAKATSNAKTSQPAKSATAAEIAFWNSIKDSANPDDFKAYLKKYPNGDFADLARNRLRTLEASQPKTSATPEAPKETAPANTNETDVKPGNAKDLSNPKSANGSSPPKPGTVVKTRTGIELVLIPAGSFTMGSSNGSSEMPVHQVTINYSFDMGKYEVTQEQWQWVMGNNPSNFKNCGNCPVEEVSWDDAQAFIRKLNQMNDDYTYRLPTESEWEYSCRAGTTGNYAGDLDSMAWYSANSGSKTHPVGAKQPNGFGLYDMHGNVWEWCEDWYHPTYGGAPTDGSAWLSGGQQNPTVRGGSWDNVASSLRSADRNIVGPAYLRSYVIGFRLVAVARTQ